MIGLLNLLQAEQNGQGMFSGFERWWEGVLRDETNNGCETEQLAAKKMSSASATEVSEYASPVLQVFRCICHLINEQTKQAVKAILKTSLLFGALYGLKEGIQSIFQCPFQGHLFYGSLYLFGPAVFFLCFAFAFSRPFWEFATGCFRLSCSKRLLTSPGSAVDIYLAISAPFLWVAYGLSQERYYICAMYGPVNIELLYMREEWIATYKGLIWISDAKARCHFLVWGIILSWAITSAVLVSLYRCHNRRHHGAEIEKKLKTVSRV